MASVLQRQLTEPADFDPEGRRNAGAARASSAGRPKVKETAPVVRGRYRPAYLDKRSNQPGSEHLDAEGGLRSGSSVVGRWDHETTRQQWPNHDMWRRRYIVAGDHGRVHGGEPPEGTPGSAGGVQCSRLHTTQSAQSACPCSAHCSCDRSVPRPGGRRTRFVPAAVLLGSRLRIRTDAANARFDVYDAARRYWRARCRDARRHPHTRRCQAGSSACSAPCLSRKDHAAAISESRRSCPATRVRGR